MDLAVITAQQVAELFILIGLGALGAKTDLLRPEGKQTLSNLLVNLVVPAMIINSYRMEFSAEILHNLMAAFALSTLSILLGLIITLLFTARSRDSRTPIFRFACVFSNAGYMGLPLISALFGSEGLLYASAFFTLFNLLLWTVGYSMVSGSSDPKKVAQSLLHCPAIYAIVVGLVLYLLQIPLPDLIVQPMELLGDMNTPLSMLITGMLIASGDLHRTLTDKHIWKLTVVRMLFIPVLTIAAFAALGLFRYGMVTQVILLLECCPAASITSVFAVQFHHDEQVCRRQRRADHPAQHRVPAAVCAYHYDVLTSQSASQTAPLSGEPLASRVTLYCLPKAHTTIKGRASLTRAGASHSLQR